MRQQRTTPAWVGMLAGFALVAALSAGCSSKQPAGAPPEAPAAPSKTPAAGGIVINGAGATFPYPIYSKWFQAYHAAHPNVDFNYQPVGSGAGIAQYQAGTVDFGASDAPLSADDLAKLPQKTVEIPTVAGAVVLAYNLSGVKSGLKLSGDVIADIYLGKIKAWNDPRIVAQNPSVQLPATAITVAHRADGSGTTYIFTNYLSAVSPEWKTKVGAGKSVNWPVGVGGNQNAGVAGQVSHTPGGIGYVELAYAVQNKLTYGPVKNRAGNYVEATVASTAAAANDGAPRMAQDVALTIVDGSGPQTYPIAGFTYLLVPAQPKDAVKGQALVDFLKWAMADGKPYAEQLLYAPLPQSVVQLNDAALAKVGAAGG